MNRFVSVIERIAYLGGYLSGWLVPLMMMLVVVLEKDGFFTYLAGRLLTA